MKHSKAVAIEEWRYWSRSRLALGALIVALLLTIVATLTTVVRMSELSHERDTLQTHALETFYAQPDRHPHRMVHYGHYAFRTPPPLGIVDPGLDRHTGNVIFLEGHRQNTAMFAERESAAAMSAIGGLSPAFVMQVLAPLCLILLGYGAMTREREAGTLIQLFSQGIPMGALLSGKALALLTVSLLILVPFAVGTAIAVARGEPWLTGAGMVGGYAAYLFLWSLIVVLVSSRLQRSNASLIALLGLWIVISLVLPSVANSSGRLSTDSPGKIESDFALLEELREMGDGHNAADPNFASFKTNLLAAYGVDRIEDLPINFRGAVAEKAEADLTERLRHFAEERYALEAAQAADAGRFGWLSPVIAVRDYSMAIAGTDLAAHHRFLREVEEVRFQFVQALNSVHAKQVSYQDDVNRSNDPDSERRSRASASNWRSSRGLSLRGRSTRSPSAARRRSPPYPWQPGCS